MLGDQQVLFKIHTGRNNLKSGTFTVESSGNQIKYALESAKVLSEGKCLLDAYNDQAEDFLKPREPLAVPKVGLKWKIFPPTMS